MKLQSLPISSLCLDGGTCVRAELKPELVDKYERCFRAGEQPCPPLDVVSDGTTFWLVDGFHRAEAARRAGEDDLPCNVREGTLASATWDACGNHRGHTKYSSADKRRAVEAALRVRPNESDMRIAEHCGVANHLVAETRAAMCPAQEMELGESPSSTQPTDQRTQRRLGRDGKEYPAMQNTSTAPGAARKRTGRPAGPTPENLELAERVRVLEEDHPDLTATQKAEKLGITRANYSNLKRVVIDGKRKDPSLDPFRKVVDSAEGMVEGLEIMIDSVAERIARLRADGRHPDADAMRRLREAAGAISRNAKKLEKVVGK